MLVVDASALLEFYLGTARAPAVAAHLSRASTLHAPHLVDLEVARVLRRAVRLGRASEARADDALRDHLDLDLQRYEHALLLRRVWELRHVLTSYDAAYVALAELLDAPLLTWDQRLLRSPGHRARVLRPA